MSEAGSRPSSDTKRSRDAWHDAIQVLQAQIADQKSEVEEAERLLVSSQTQLETIDGYSQHFGRSNIVGSLLDKRQKINSFGSTSYRRCRHTSHHWKTTSNVSKKDFHEYNRVMK